jgi:hypothetical protein
MKLVKEDSFFLNGCCQTYYCGELNGVVTESENLGKNESTLVIKTKTLEERVKLPFKVHSKVLIGSQINLQVKKTNIYGRRITGWDGGDPIMENADPYAAIDYILTITAGEYEGIIYRGSSTAPLTTNRQNKC